MEGWRWRAIAVVACAAAAAVGVGCGASGSERGEIVATDEPEVAFAPVVHLHPDEQFMPMGARWFIGRSVLRMAYGSICGDARIAVGRLLESQRTKVTDWIYVPRLGWGRGYWRQVYADAGCERRRQAHRYYANQLTRPRDERPDRAPGLYADEGYFLDLMDWGRGGRPVAERDGQAVVDVEAWYERRRVEVDGEPGIRITYWMLYGMNQPSRPDDDETPIAELAHEGDWERVQVVLREGDEPGEWEPRSVRLADIGGGWRELDWGAVPRVPGPGAAAATHPVVLAARGSHTAYARAGRHQRSVDAGGWAVEVEDVATGPCRACPRWRTWERLSEARKRHWYTFGGAWGETGPTSLTTGPLGPHGRWAIPHPGEQTARMERRP